MHERPGITEYGSDDIVVTDKINNAIVLLYKADGSGHTSMYTGANTGPYGVSVNQAGTFAYVSCNGSSGDRVLKVNMTAGNIAATYYVGSKPQGLAVTPDGSKVYVANYVSNTVSRIRVSDGNILNISVGIGPMGVACSPDGAYIYITNYADSTVSKITVSNDTVTTTYANTLFGGTGAGLRGIAISPDGNTMFAASRLRYVVYSVNTAGSGSSSTTYNTSPYTTWTNWVAVSPDGTKLLATNMTNQKVSIWNIGTAARQAAVGETNDGTEGIQVDSTSTYAYTITYNVHHLHRISLSDNSYTTINSTMSTGGGTDSVGNCFFRPIDLPSASDPISSSTSVIYGQNITVTDQSTGGTSFDWDWGDSTAHDSGSSAVHTYAHPGTYQVVETVYNNAGYDVITPMWTVTMDKATPTLTWSNPAAIIYGTDMQNLSTSPSSGGLAGNYSYSPALTAIQSAGTHNVTATFTPTDTTDYNTTQVNCTVTVNKSTPAITWSAPSAITYGTALSGTQLNAGNNLSIAGAYTYTPASGIVLGVGVQTLNVSFVPTDTTNYTNCSGSVSLTVNKYSPRTTWSTPSAITYGTALSGTQLNANANTASYNGGSVAGSFAYTPASGTVLGAGTQTLNTIFTPSGADATNYSTNSTNVSLTVNKAAPTITWNCPSQMLYGVPITGAQLNAVASLAGDITYSRTNGTILAAGVQTLNCTFTPTDTTNYSTVNTNNTITVTQSSNTTEPYTRTIKIDYTRVAGNAQYIPVLVNLSGDTGVGAHANSNGYDLWFTADGVTSLPYDREYYNITGGACNAQIWIRMPGVSSAYNSLVYMRYGNHSATDLSNSTGVWDAGGSQYYGGVWHLKETGTGSAYDYKDSTVNAINSTSTTGDPTATTAGQIDGAENFSTNAYITFPNSSLIKPTSAITIEAWIKPLYNLSSNYWIFTNGNDYNNATGVNLYEVNGRIYFEVGSGATQAGTTISSSANSIWCNTWYHVVGTYASGTGLKLYLNGTQVASSSAYTGSLGYDSRIPNIGRELTTYYLFNGTIDEVRLSSVVRSASWVSTEFNNTANPASFETIGAEASTYNVTWATPAAITYGTTLSGTQLNAASGSAAGTFAYTPAAGTVLGVGTQTLSATFTPTDTTNYSSATISTTIIVNKASPVITWATPATIIYGTALSGTQLSATCPQSGSFSYSPATGITLGVGNQTLNVTFTPSGVDATNYTTNNTSVSLTVTQATPAITWATPAPIVYGTALNGTQLNAGNNLSVVGSYVYSPASGTVLDVGSQILNVTFNPTDSTNYSSATGSVTLTVNKVSSSVTWSTPVAITYGTALSATQLNAGNTLGLAGSYVYNPTNGTVLAAGTQTLHVTFNPTDTDNYSSSTGSVSLTINKASTSVTWAAPANITYGTALNATQLNANGSVTGSMVYSPTSGAVLGAGSQVLNVSFVPTDSTNYSSCTGNTTLIVNKATPTITWTPPASITYGTMLSGTQLNAQANVIQISANLLTNPSFESGSTIATSWTDLHTTMGEPTYSLSTTEGVVNGAKSQKMVYNGQAGDDGSKKFELYQYPSNEVHAGDVLNFSVWLTGSMTHSYAYLVVDSYDASMTWQGMNRVYIGTLTGTPTLYSVLYTCPANAKYCDAYIVFPEVYSDSSISVEMDSASLVDTTNTSLTGSFTYNPAAGVVLGAGAHTLNCTFTPTDSTNYTTNTSSVSFTVNTASPVITWATPAAITYGTALSATQLSATCPQTGSFSYSPASGTVLGAGTQTLNTTFIPSGVDATNYTTNTTSVSLTINKVSPTISWTTPANITNGTALSGVQLNANCSIAGSFVYFPVAGTVLSAGLHTLNATFTPTDATNYSSSTINTTINVLDFGTLNLTANVANCTLVIDNVSYGDVVPTNGESIRVPLLEGNHLVNVSHVDYDSNSTAIVIPALGQVNLNVTLNGLPGTLVINTNPVGARVFLDGIPYSVTPRTIPSVSYGNHALLLNATGYYNDTETVFVFANHSHIYQFNMTEINGGGNVTPPTPPTPPTPTNNGILKIATVPLGSEVYVGNIDNSSDSFIHIGTTPLPSQYISDYTVTHAFVHGYYMIKVTNQHYQDTYMSVLVGVNDTVTYVTISLPTKPGAISLDSTPLDSTIYLNNVKLVDDNGTAITTPTNITNLDVTYPYTTYNVTLEHAGYFTESDPVPVYSDQTTPVSMTMHLQAHVHITSSVSNTTVTYNKQMYDKDGNWAANATVSLGVAPIDQDIAASTYTFTASCPDYYLQDQTVTIAPYENKNIDFQLEHYPYSGVLNLTAVPQNWSVQLQTDPSYAAYTLTGGDYNGGYNKGPKGMTYSGTWQPGASTDLLKLPRTMFTGTYTLAVSCGHFYTLTDTIVIIRDQITNYEADLRPMNGTVRVCVYDPDNVMVTADNAKKGYASNATSMYSQLPMGLTNYLPISLTSAYPKTLLPKQHIIELDKPGYGSDVNGTKHYSTPWTVPIDDYNYLVARLYPTLYDGALTIRTSPADCNIAIDSVPVGSGPVLTVSGIAATVSYRAPTHHVATISKDGYVTKTITFYTPSGSNGSMQVTLYPTGSTGKCSLQIYPNPADCNIIIDGPGFTHENLGVAPIHLDGIDAGTYTLTATHAGGYINKTETITIAGGQSYVWSPSLGLYPCQLNINVQPYGAYVYLNQQLLVVKNNGGQIVGYNTTPQSEILQPGTYIVQTMADGYLTHIETVTLNPGDNITLDSTMQKAEPLINPLGTDSPIVTSASLSNNNVYIGTPVTLTVRTSTVPDSMLAELLTPNGYEYYPMMQADGTGLVWQLVYTPTEQNKYNFTRALPTINNNIHYEWLKLPFWSWLYWDAATEPPIAAFSSSYTSGEVPLTTQFYDQSKNLPTTWSWNFGDGTTSSEMSPTHTYTVTGSYTVTLTVTNSAGTDTIAKTQYISVTDIPYGYISKIHVPMSTGIRTFMTTSQGVNVTTQSDLYAAVLDNVTTGYGLAALMVLALAAAGILRYLGFL